MPSNETSPPRRERENDQLTFLHDICSQKPEQIEYRRRRRLEIEDEERESVLVSWSWMFVAAVIIGVPAGLVLWFLEPIARVLALLAGASVTAFQYRSARNQFAQRKSFIFLLITAISALSLLVFLNAL